MALLFELHSQDPILSDVGWKFKGPDTQALPEGDASQGPTDAHP